MNPPSFNGVLSSSDGFRLENQSVMDFSNGRLEKGTGFEVPYPDQNHVNVHINQSSSFEEEVIGGLRFPENKSLSNGTVSSSFTDNDDDCDFSDAVLRYIDQMLMEEDMEEKSHMLQESLDFQAKEKSFYDVLGKKYPPSPQQESAIINQYGQNGDDSSFVNRFNSTTSSSDGSGYLIDVVCPRWIQGRVDTAYDMSRSSNSLNNIVDGLSDSPISPLDEIRDMYSESQLERNFKKGVDEASKFLPSGSKLLVNGSIARDEVRSVPFHSKGKKNRHIDLEDDDRISKLPAVSSESDVPVEEFDNMLLHTLGDGDRKSVV